MTEYDCNGLLLINVSGTDELTEHGEEESHEEKPEEKVLSIVCILHIFT